MNLNVYRITPLATVMLLWSLAICGNTHAATYDVTEAPFNATGDGVTNDTTAINLALATAYNDGGGTVFLPAGTYVVDRLDIGSNTEIVGDRAGATVLKRATSSDQAMLVADATGTVPGATGIIVSKIAFDGNKAEAVGTPSSLSFVGTDNFQVFDCVLYAAAGNALTCNNASNGTLRNVECSDSTASAIYLLNCQHMDLAGCFASTSGGHGYEFKTCDDVYVVAAHATENSQSGFYIGSCINMLLEGCLAQSNTSEGFQVYATSVINENISFAACVARLNDTGFSITDTRTFTLAACMANENQIGIALIKNIRKCRNFSLSGCHVVDNQKEGITLQGAMIGSITGSLIKNNSQAQANTYDGIHMADGGGHVCKKVRISGCSITDAQTLPTQRRAITTTGGSYRNTITYNDVADNSTTPAIQLVGTDNIETLNMSL